MSIAALDGQEPTNEGLVGEGDDSLREIKQALVTCFGGVDGQIQNADGNPPTAAEFSALFTAIAALGAQGTFEIGMIMAFNAIGSIPAGWALCDGGLYQGVNGPISTPDLRQRFPIGGLPGFAGFEYGDTGGALPGSQTTGPAGATTAEVNVPDHILTNANLPQHRHAIFSPAEASGSGTTGNPALPSRSAAVRWATGSVSNNYGIQDDASQATPSVGVTDYQGQASPTAVTHGTAQVTIDDHTHSISGSSLPPYLAVRYIMFIGVAAP